MYELTVCTNVHCTIERPSKTPPITHASFDQFVRKLPAAFSSSTMFAICRAQKTNTNHKRAEISRCKKK